jgi:hypothetical protein
MAWVSDTVFSLLVVLCGTFGASTLAFGVAWMRARERAIRAEQRAAPAADPGAARYEGLASAVDSITTELDQLAEGQRFVTRLLSERAGADRAGGARPAHVTSAP